MNINQNFYARVAIFILTVVTIGTVLGCLAALIHAEPPLAAMAVAAGLLLLALVGVLLAHWALSPWEPHRSSPACTIPSWLRNAAYPPIIPDPSPAWRTVPEGLSVGGGLDLRDTGIAALNGTDVAFIDGDNGERRRTYRWNGSAWALVGT